jgi:hypothetical protein
MEYGARGRVKILRSLAWEIYLTISDGETRLQSEGPIAGREALQTILLAHHEASGVRPGPRTSLGTGAKYGGGHGVE